VAVERLTGFSLSDVSIWLISSNFQLSLMICQLPRAIKIKIKKNTKIENRNLYLKG